MRYVVHNDINIFKVFCIKERQIQLFEAHQVIFYAIIPIFLCAIFLFPCDTLTRIIYEISTWDFTSIVEDLTVWSWLKSKAIKMIWCWLSCKLIYSIKFLVLFFPTYHKRNAIYVHNILLSLPFLFTRVRNQCLL